MIKIFCDRCGKQIEGSEYVNMVTHYSFFNTQTWNLCKDCTSVAKKILEAERTNNA